MTTGKLAAWGPPMRIAALEPRVTRIVGRPRQSFKEQLVSWSVDNLVSSNAFEFTNLLIYPFTNFRLAPEYSANGSFSNPLHAAVSACMFLLTRSEAPVVRAKPGQKNNMVKPHG